MILEEEFRMEKEFLKDTISNNGYCINEIQCDNCILKKYGCNLKYIPDSTLKLAKNIIKKYILSEKISEVLK